MRVKNKIDHHLYAIKRVRIASNHRREKIMREVAVLSSLNHRNVVRYFNAWVEGGAEEWETKQSSLPPEDGSSTNWSASEPYSESGELKSKLNSPMTATEHEEDQEETSGVPQYLYIQMELAQSTLQDYISQKRKPEQILWDFFGQLLCGELNFV